ncbi:hypothetical protein NYY72_19195, partial [Acinetobacter baumannii]|nr:hypothetical protein [Acinetobacter baumannii]
AAFDLAPFWRLSFLLFVRAIVYFVLGYAKTQRSKISILQTRTSEPCKIPALIDKLGLFNFLEKKVNK